MVLIFVLLSLLLEPALAVLIPNIPEQPRSAAPPAALPTERCTDSDVSSKDLDLILYGVTGFTGRLAANYLMEHPEKPNWAVAGRDKIKLNYVRTVITQNNSKPVEGLAFGMKNAGIVREMTNRARVIVNFAGPFERNGAEVLIRAALATCTHYVDITTETHWKAKILKKYASVAEKRGVAIVQSAGFSSVASDLLAMSAIQDVVEAQQEPPTNVMVVWTKFNDGASGGQIAAAQSELMNGPNKDAYILAPDLAENQKVDWKIDGMESYGLHDRLGKLVESALAPMDCPVIRRSIKLQFPLAAVSVQQAATTSLAEERMLFLNNQTVLATNPPAQMTPKPGHGPPIWVQRRGSFAGLAMASGKWVPGVSKMGAHQARVTMDGHGDPSFMGSARMATEVALGLARNGAESNKAGYLTPSAALGTRILEDRLRRVDGGRFMTISHE